MIDQSRLGDVKRPKRSHSPKPISADLQSRLREPVARLSTSDIAALTNQSTRTVRRDVQRGLLPKPHTKGGSANWWLVRDVQGYLVGLQNDDAPVAETGGGE